MYKSLALSALLLRTAEATGCYPAWTSGSAYSSGALVSAVRVVNATAGTTVTKNFECSSGDTAALSHCPTYDPANEVQAAAAWTDLGACTGAAGSATTGSPTNSPTHPAWSGAGCPNDWVEDAEYEGGDLATYDGNAYKCSEEQFVNVWCGKIDYKPGDSQFWTSAWTLLGSCDGTIAPTSSPVYVSLTAAGGCPDAFDSDATYEEGDKVEKNGLVYKCRAWPNSAWCSMQNYEPDGEHSGDAWERLGYCDGTIAPTTSPNFVSLVDAGGCPNAYDAATTYEGGDKVTIETDAGSFIVYECAASPNDRYCNQYEPGHWSNHGWTIKGYCDGTIAPTTSPVFVSLTDHNGCPEAYSSTQEYEASDKVSVDIDGTNSLVYQCSSDVHESKWCNQNEPGDAGQLGWRLIGHCDGTISPTSAPAFTSLADVGGGCPPAYDEATTYEEGDVASLARSDNPDRVVVYECKAWPSGAYCNAGPNYAPGSANSALGWTLKGSCSGTMAPSTSPVVYTPAAKCRWYNGTQAVTINNWAESSLSTYIAGTRVRKEDRIYKCKGYPYSLWCKMAAYEPEETAYWAEAWTTAGTCVDMLAPTTSPSVSPTSSPSSSPSASPSKSPTKSPA
jgi:hypothetical protein